MYILSWDALDDLDDDELWEVASDTRNSTDIRYEAIARWLFPDDGNPDDESGLRAGELRKRATILGKHEVEEDDIEEFDRTGPYFDGEGRLIVEHDGVQYLIDSDEDNYLDVDEGAAV